MAVRTKTELRAAALAMFPDNNAGDIVPADARGLLTDAIDSLSEGMPVHLVTGPAYNVTTGLFDLAGLPDLEIPALLLVKLPTVLPRSSVVATVRVGGIDEMLTDIDNVEVAARLLTPGSLVGMVRYSGAVRLTEPLLPRPQDFRIVASWLPTGAFDQASFESFVSDDANHGWSDIASVYVPRWTGTNANELVGRVFGVPVNAPDLDFIETGTSRIVASRIPPWDDREYKGSPYKWWNMRRTTGTLAMQNYIYHVEFLPGT